ncbi:class I SAM-dependent methyltransferase [Flavivirga jejuensis]|uniref:Class I SAM-dependent methyltransferase n=1 Tax=Flavivirga jejuensis TaxID=870487 RepID=A0ABT8WS08_9FLAO|nr:class I SAM-dependent methyltransferase [Flavivirga jejuensis]MDO5975790.1 class I SAM-dependent methyltransferase [Flavivirga jejuensis]
MKTLVKKLMYSAPKKMQKNHLTFSEKQVEELKNSLESNYLDRGDTKSRLTKQEYDRALNGQLFERLAYNRNRIAPWLNSIKGLKGANILEIGCGTGISTLALSEQGANVTGIDVDEGALNVAKDRMKMAGFDTELHLMNADEIKENFKTKKFDFIIYYAVLEHMTIKERLSSLKQAWDILPEGSFLSVIETPNRLWYYDSHTAAMPFYDWLPDELAFYYSKFSDRKNFKDSYRELNDDNMMKFLRWGRGASYHEFEIAIAPLKDLNVVGSLMQFEKTTLFKAGIKGMRHIKFLKSLNKNLHSGFCYPYLDIVLKK